MVKIAFLIVILGTSASRADNRNRNLFPMGQKEALLANTGTALSGSLGSVYYNPGALATISKNQMGLFGSSYFYSEYNADAIMYADNSDIPFKSFNSDSKPTSYITGFKSGQYVLAFSILVPGAIQVSNFQSWKTPNARITVANTSDSEEMWFGFSAAKKISSSCGMGISAFFIKTRSLFQQYRRIVVTATPNIPVISMAQVNSEIYNAAATAGLLCNVDDSDVDFGIRIQSPSTRISGKADILYAVDKVVPVEHTEIRDTSDSVQYILPLDASIGVGMRPSKWTRLYMDISAQASSDYDTLPGHQFNNKWSTQSAIRYNVGVEALLSNTSSILAGGAYNPSANQVVARDGDDKNDFFEVTLGYQNSLGGLTFGVGAFYLWSTGERVITLTYEKGQTQTKVLGLLLSTSYAY